MRNFSYGTGLNSTEAEGRVQVWVEMVATAFWFLRALRALAETKSENLPGWWRSGKLFSLQKKHTTSQHPRFFILIRATKPLIVPGLSYEAETRMNIGVSA